MSHTTQTHATYCLSINDDLQVLIEEAIALEQQVKDAKEYSEKRQDLENRLYDLYQDIGWSVVYDMKGLLMHPKNTLQ
jgi:hypothetical protein